MSAKNLDHYERFRSKTVAFRVSPEEWKQVNLMVEVSGMTKQDYLVSKMLDKAITVKGGAKVYRGIVKCLEEIKKELLCAEGQSIETEELIQLIYYVAGVVDRLNSNNSRMA